MIGLVLCHGWGFAPNYWDILIPHLQPFPIIQWDLGYFFKQKITIPPPGNWFAIGHSLGFAKLLDTPFPWKGLVSLSGYTQFCEHDDPTYHSISKMQKNVLKNPKAVLHAFYKKCKISYQASSNIQADILYQDLHRIQQLSSPYNSSTPLLALASKNDPIVSWEMTQKSFPTSLIGFDTPTHCIDHLEPQQCALHIKKFILQVCGTLL